MVNSPEELKTAIVQDILTRMSFLSQDASTFLWCKCRPEFSMGFGGGNFMVTAMSLIMLEYLAGVHAHLTNPELMFSATERSEQSESWKKVVESLKKSEQSKADAENLLKSLGASPSARVGSHRNAAMSVFKLLKEAKESGIRHGFPEGFSLFENLWNGARNGLVHLASPKKRFGASAFSPPSGTPFLDIMRAICVGQYDGSVVIEENGRYSITGEVLALSLLPRIAIWVVEKVVAVDCLDRLVQARLYSHGMPMNSEAQVNATVESDQSQVTSAEGIKSDPSPQAGTDSD